MLIHVKTASGARYQFDTIGDHAVEVSRIAPANDTSADMRFGGVPMGDFVIRVPAVPRIRMGYPIVIPHGVITTSVTDIEVTPA